MKPMLAIDTVRRASEAELEAIRAYIAKGWHELRRSHRHLLAAAIDVHDARPKRRWPVYVPACENLEAIRQRLSAEGVPDAQLAQIELRRLPDERSKLDEHGMLWLPEPYVVPGGRFNEMYGWDSYFIVVGLLRDGEVELARGMVDNFRYEIENYGTILNANRTYFLTRSQPPFFTEMLRAVYEHTGDEAWLRASVPAIEKHYAFWTTGPRLTATGLSRYYDTGTGPAPEVLAGKRDAAGRSHYDRIRNHFRTHAIADCDLERFYDAANDTLTDVFYANDRAMRESGFDLSNRFGPLNLAVIDMNPVCLNSLLYQMELDAAEIARTLGDAALRGVWESRAAARKVRFQELLWDPRAGLYFDYDCTTNARRRYPFATTFWPLWVGLADAEQARRVVENLPLFEQPGGLATSTVASGCQWDLPYGWAPLHLLAVKALRRYGYSEAADRITTRFLSLVLKVFLEENVIVEKYDVVERKSATGFKFGYATNEIGFGWTNAAFVELLAELPPAKRADILR